MKWSGLLSEVRISLFVIVNSFAPATRPLTSMKSSSPSVAGARLDVVALVVARHLLRLAAERVLGGEHGVDGEPLDALGLAGVDVRLVGALAAEPLEQAARDDERAAGDDRRKRRELALPGRARPSAASAGLELVGALARAAGVHLRLLAGELLLLELVRAVVPVLDLVREPALHGVRVCSTRSVGLPRRPRRGARERRARSRSRARPSRRRGRATPPRSAAGRARARRARSGGSRGRARSRRRAAPSPGSARRTGAASRRPGAGRPRARCAFWIACST